jgi:tRNA A-37 threonylcarbamoyl transferase component Bud32
MCDNVIVYQMPYSRAKRKSKSSRRSKSGGKRKIKSKSLRISGASKKHAIKRSKSVAKRSKSKRSIGSQSRHRYGGKFDSFLPMGYSLIRKLGSGAAGIALLLCRNGSDCKVLKVSKLKDPKVREHFERELVMHKKFEAAGIGPRIFRTGKFRKGDTEYGVIEMARVSGTFDDLLKVRQSKKVLDWIVESVDKIVDKLCEYGLIHGDTHFGNLAYNEQPNGKRKPMMIDFGLACCKKKTKCNPALEYLTIIRDMPFDESGIEDHNLDYLMDRFISIYRKRYDPNLSDDWKSIDRKFNKRRSDYAPKLKSKLKNPF